MRRGARCFCLLSQAENWGNPRARNAELQSSQISRWLLATCICHFPVLVLVLVPVPVPIPVPVSVATFARCHFPIAILGHDSVTRNGSASSGFSVSGWFWFFGRTSKSLNSRQLSGLVRCLAIWPIVHVT